MRKHYLDNARYVTIAIVILCHIFDPYLEFVYTNDEILLLPVAGLTYFVEPWFMQLFFVIAGACAYYSLKNASGAASLKPFLVSKIKGLLIPAVSYIFLFGWVQYTIGFLFFDPGAKPPFTFENLYLYMIVILGPMWFLFELFAFSALLALICKIDKNEWLHRLGEKPWLYLFVLIPVLLIPQFKIAPDETISFNLVYFLTGYIFFSQEKTEQILKKYWYLFAIPALAADLYVAVKDYRIATFASGWEEKLCSWLAIPAVLAVFIRFFDKETRFTKYMQTHSFPFFMLMQPVLYISGYAATRLGVPGGYPMIGVLTLSMAVLLPLLTFLIRKIPGIRYILFRDRGPQKGKSS